MTDSVENAVFAIFLGGVFFVVLFTVEVGLLQGNHDRILICIGKLTACKHAGQFGNQLFCLLSAAASILRTGLGYKFLVFGQQIIGITAELFRQLAIRYGFSLDGLLPPAMSSPACTENANEAPRQNEQNETGKTNNKHPAET